MRFPPPPIKRGCRLAARRVRPGRAQRCAAFVRRRRIAIPATTSSWTLLDAGGNGAGSSPGKHSLRLVQASNQEEASNLQVPRMRGVQPVTVFFERHARCIERFLRPAQVARGKRDLGFGDDAPRSCHGFFGLKARRADRSSACARWKSPSCAIAIPRSASAGASSRSATRFNAPRGSPLARARAAAVIRESIEIPPHLSLSARSTPASLFVYGRHAIRSYSQARMSSSKEGHMCPVCIASTAVMVAGAGSTGGILAVVHRQVQEIFQSDWSRSISENKGAIRWQ